MEFKTFFGPEPGDTFNGWRCIKCGEIIDQVILENRIWGKGWKKRNHQGNEKEEAP